MNVMDFDAIVFREENTFISHCPELDVSSCGKTIDEARYNLKTAVRLFVEEAEKMGTLEDILQESGFKQNPDGKWQAPQLVATEIMQLGPSI
ncbi:MAG: type II toxin-antitoxin system HicB family antitoxin [Nitrospirae bacterium]|nr:type II toxin-antitoxin system HicB family antitoxin [Nitrospirota bacterium]MDA1303053.1 type II toxin-antitoxin system HicB family antitoxin [Nitrospirota bacterium]